MAKWVYIVLAAILACHASAAVGPDARELILAASLQANIPRLTVQETRKLYLGLPVEKNGVTLKPLLNTSDNLLFEVFLQKVTFMSSEAYEKQVLSIVFRLGGQRPEAIGDKHRLNALLLEQPDSVTFMWSSDLNAYRGLKPVGTLWTGAAN